MAKIVITIEDSVGGGVKVACNPTFEEIMKMEISGETLTSAHGYAFAALNSLRKESKSNDPHRIIIPKIGY